MNNLDIYNYAARRRPCTRVWMDVSTLCSKTRRNGRVFHWRSFTKVYRFIVSRPPLEEHALHDILHSSRDSSSPVISSLFKIFPPTFYTHDNNFDLKNYRLLLELESVYCKTIGITRNYSKIDFLFAKRSY